MQVPAQNKQPEPEKPSYKAIGKLELASKQQMFSLVSRYSEFILFRPAFSWRNAWLWGLPVLLLIIGVVIAVRVIRERAALVDNDDDPDAFNS